MDMAKAGGAGRKMANELYMPNLANTLISSYGQGVSDRQNKMAFDQANADRAAQDQRRAELFKIVSNGVGPQTIAALTKGGYIDEAKAMSGLLQSQNSLNDQQRQSMIKKAYAIGTNLSTSENPKGLIQSLSSDPDVQKFIQQFEQYHGPGSFSQLDDEQLRNVGKTISDQYASLMGEAQARPKKWETINGPRGSVIQRDPITGEQKQVVGPDNSFDGMTEYQRRTLALKESKQSGSPSGPQLPPAALKLVDDATQAIGSSEESLSLVDSALGKLNSGQLKLGAVNNLVSRAKNAVGASDASSLSYADLQQTFEKLRANYLLLAKGVQTEGDATRAWNAEIGENAQNDNRLAQQQLTKAKGMINRMLSLQNKRIDTVYSNYGTSAPRSLMASPAAQPNSNAGGIKFLGFE